MSELLAPPPRRLRRTGGSIRLAAAALAAPRDPTGEPALERLAEGLGGLGVAVRRLGPGERPEAAESPVRLRTEPEAEAEAGTEGYRLEVGTAGVDVTAPAGAGLFYGAETLLQWLTAHAPAADGPLEAPAVRIDDRPVFRHRGFLLDVSRNRVPTMDCLFELVDRIAALKLNQLQLYTEHTFAYRGHEVVWRGASPLTGAEIRELDARCRRRFVELVPNQNSFGHLHRWLRHEPYRRLAEVPEGVKHPFGGDPEPFSLCPVDPAAVELLRDLYDQLLPHFTSGQLNVGCDETFDLGKGRSAEACRERGTGEVYLAFLRRLRALAAGHGRRIQFWGDILASHPELLDRVPRDAVVLEWGYEAGHPFAERLAPLAAAGLEVYICPGTSSWNSYAGRLENAVTNLAEAARSGLEHGASGYLVTDWGDNGHLQPPPISWPPLVAGASFAWNPGAAAAQLPLEELVDRCGPRRPAPGTGAALAALGDAYRQIGVTPMNASALFKLVDAADRSLADAGLGELTVEGLDRAEAAVAEGADRLASLGAPPARGGVSPAESDLVRRELAWAAAMLRLGCALGRARLTGGGEASVAALPARRRRELASELGRRIEELEPLWLARSRPGGLDDSRGRLERLLERLS